MKLRFLQNIQVLTLLMVMAGVFLGLFASRLIARPTRAPEAPRQRAIEHEVRYYQKTYRLGEVAADAIRRALREYEDDRLALLRKLQAEHPHDFDALRQRAEERIRDVVREAEGRAGTPTASPHSAPTETPPSKKDRARTGTKPRK